MMRSLFSGVAGLRNHQTRMDTIGNNIANVNTTGFKAGRVNFQDMLSQTLQGAAGPQGTTGGTNPMQVGLGMSVASMDTQFTSGALQSTGVPTDLAISGDGFFVLSDGKTQSFTRDGSFKFDTNGNYVVPGTGLKVQGWMADSLGNINTAGAVTDIIKPIGITMPAKQSTSVAFTGNLNATTANGSLAATSTNLYDSLGTKHLMSQTYYKVNVGPNSTDTGANTWICKTDVAGITSGSLTNQYTQLNFNSDGTLNTIKTLTPPANITAAPSTTQNLTFSNLQLNNTLNQTSVYTFSEIDSTGVAHPITATFKCTANTPDAWSLQFSDASGNLGAATTGIAWSGTAYTGLPASFTYTGTGAVTNTVNLQTTLTPAAPAAGTSAGWGNGVNTGTIPTQNVTLNSLKLSTSSDPQVLGFSEFDNNGTLRTFKTTFTYNSSSNNWSAAVTESGDATNTVLATIPNITWNGANYLVNGAAFPGASGSFTYKGSDAAGTLNVVNFNALGTPVKPDATLISGCASEPTGSTLQTSESAMSFSIPGANAMTITSDRSKITQSSATTSDLTITQDGYGMGQLNDVTFDSRGVMTGVFSNNQKKQLGQVALASFNNNNGLMKSGNNTYVESNNSGAAKIGEANTSGRGTLTPAALEMSNVDLSQEFSNMIITQRGFQANSKIITTSDTMLEELVNLKR